MIDIDNRDSQLTCIFLYPPACSICLLVDFLQRLEHICPVAPVSANTCAANNVQKVIFDIIQLSSHIRLGARVCSLAASQQ